MRRPRSVGRALVGVGDRPENGATTKCGLWATVGGAGATDGNATLQAVGKHCGVASHVVGTTNRGGYSGFAMRSSHAAKNRFAKSGQMVSTGDGGPDGLASIFNRNGT